MKRIISSLFLSLFCVAYTFAYDVEVDGIYYDIITKIKTAEVTYGDVSYSGAKVIPSTIKVDGIEYSVKSIKNYAFTSCTKLTSVTIPNSVTSIGDHAFNSCSSLTSVTIPSSVTSIGKQAFGNSYHIKSVNINSIEAWCKIKFETYNSNPLFSDENCLLYLNGEKVTDLVIPNSVTSIEEYAFNGYAGLTSVIIPNSVVSIGRYAFQHCSSLITVTIGNSVTSIGDWAFYSCKNLTSVTIGNSVTKIWSCAFQECSRLTSVNIPNSVTYIGDLAFEGCSNLTSVNIPNSVTDIGIYAFGNSGITSITIPNSVSNIEKQTFYNCSLLTSVTIGSSVKSIGSSTFASCKNLETVTCLATSLPSTSSDAFKDSYVNYATLIVPEASLQAYKTTSPWSEFGTFKTYTKDVTINDNCTTYVHEEEEGSKNISYTRTFSNTSWQALYVPFSMNYNDWKDDFDVAFINNVNQYDDNEDGTIDRTVMEVIKMKEGKSIEPNTPYLIKAKTTGEKTITLENATLYKTEEKTYSVTSWFDSFNFTGTYHTISDMATKGYYAMAGGALKQATSDTVTLQPFRWYLSVTDRKGNPVPLKSKTMSIVFDDGEATGIETINNEAKENSSIHTLTGISKGNDTKALAPGIYIKNGKKFIVK